MDRLAKRECENGLPGYVPGEDNDRIVEMLVRITGRHGDHHAKVKRLRGGRLCIIDVKEEIST